MPDIFNQLTLLITNLPSLRDEILNQLPVDAKIREAILNTAANTSWLSGASLITGVAFVLQHFVNAASQVALVFIFAIYLLHDGKRAFRWICDFFSAPIRLKLQKTATEASVVISGYVIGQITTATLAALFVYIVLSYFKVPAALTVAVLAGILDVLPVVGFLIAIVPAVVLSFTVSPGTALSVFLLYGIYHLLESNVLVPWIYGRRMKVSSLVVILALLIAGTIGGIVAAIAILPMVAAYPIIERIWLVKYLGHNVVSKHANVSDNDTFSEQVKVWAERPLSVARPLGALSALERLKTVGRTVLVVEDDDDIRSMLADVLETEGYRTLVASNGSEALEIIAQNSDVGLVLLDLMMPVMDGRTFLDILKSKESLNRIPVILLSSSVDSVDTTGAKGVLRKPCEIEEVIATVEKNYLHAKYLT